MKIARVNWDFSAISARFDARYRRGYEYVSNFMLPAGVLREIERDVKSLQKENEALKSKLKNFEQEIATASFLQIGEGQACFVRSWGRVKLFRQGKLTPCRFLLKPTLLLVNKHAKSLEN